MFSQLAGAFVMSYTNYETIHYILEALTGGVACDMPTLKGWVSVFQCPICGELMEALTNNHCQSRHHMSRKEIVSRYGVPKYVTPAMKREIQQWIHSSQVITRMDFEVAQGAVRNQVKRS